MYHDMLGMLQHPHHAQFVPRFCKNYANVGEEVRCRLVGVSREHGRELARKRGWMPVPHFSTNNIMQERCCEFPDEHPLTVGPYLCRSRPSFFFSD